MSRILFAFTGSLVIVVALVLTARPGGQAEGAAPGFVDIFAIDTDTTGNTPSLIGSVEGCRDDLTMGDTFDIDVFLRGVNVANGVSGSSFNFEYDPEVLRVNARAGATAHMFYQAVPTGTFFDVFSDPTPDADGDYRHEAAEIGGTPEFGDGVMARLTLEVVSNGVSTLILKDNIEFDAPNVLAFNGAPLAILQLGGGEIRADGSACPAATPSPNPQTPTPSPSLLTTVTVTNNTGLLVNGLHVTVTASNLFPVKQNAPGCESPSYVYGPGLPAYSNIDVVWPTKCVDPGEQVTLVFNDDCFGCSIPVVTGCSWSVDGDLVGGCSFGAPPPSGTPSPTPTPTPAPSPTPTLTSTPGAPTSTPGPTPTPTSPTPLGASAAPIAGAFPNTGGSPNGSASDNGTWLALAAGAGIAMAFAGLSFSAVRVKKDDEE